MKRSAPKIELSYTRLIAVLVFLASLLFTSCGNSCFVFVSNPNNGTVVAGSSGSGSVCGLAKPQPLGTVRVIAHVIPVCQACSPSNQIQSIFVALQGIDLHPLASGEQPPGWQRLLPQFENEPISVDLMKGQAAGRELVPAEDKMAAAAGSYDAMRVRFASGQPTSILSSGQSPCGTYGLNCVVLMDGTIQPILLGESGSELLISSERMPGRPLLILPGSDNELSLDLMPVRSVVLTADSRVRFVLALTGTVKTRRTWPLQSAEIPEPDPRE